MSFRALRKLQGEAGKLPTDLGFSGQSESDDADLSPSSVTGARRKQHTGNPFDLLNRDQSPSDNEAKEDDDKENEEGQDGKSGDEDGDKSHSTDSLKRKKKRKKRKTKPSKDKSSEDNADVEDEVEASVREVNKILGEPMPLSGCVNSGSTRKERSIYAVEHRHLNPDNEMKRIFGSKIIQAEQNKRRGRGRGHVRSTWLVQSRQNWPHVGKPGMHMALVETKGDVTYFTYEHNHHYQTIQFKFLDAVDSFNPDNIVAILNTHPYHIDSLIQLSEVCKMAEDFPMATELIERALYCFECCFHPVYNLASGHCRLDYRRSENRSFYVALFKHCLYVGQRGCYRTALEFCKLLLGLDPENDPLCVTLMIDFYTLRSGEYAFLLRMYEELETQRNLSQLPNFAFSVAMATYRLAMEEEKPTAKSDELLQHALIMFPGVLKPLMDRCSIQSDAEVAKHDFFGARAERTQPLALSQLIQLYVGRNYHLWKEPEYLGWLESNVKKVIQRVNDDDPFVMQCEEKRTKRYKGTPRNIYRHIVMAEIKDATSSLPPDVTQSAVMSYDPLPPTDAITTYARPPRLQSREDINTLGIFFRSLFPNYSEAQQNAAVAAGQDGAEGGGAAGGTAGAAAAAAAGGGTNTNDLRRSVTSLLDAMRDLLTNIHLPEVAQDADDSDTAHDN